MKGGYLRYIFSLNPNIALPDVKLQRCGHGLTWDKIVDKVVIWHPGVRYLESARKCTLDNHLSSMLSNFNFFGGNHLNITSALKFDIWEYDILIQRQKLYQYTKFERFWFFFWNCPLLALIWPLRCNLTSGSAIFGISDKMYLR